MNSERKLPILRYWHVISLLFGSAVFLFRYMIQSHMNAIEYGYSRGIYPTIVRMLSIPERWTPYPYSLSEIFIGILILMGIIWLIHHTVSSIRKKRGIGYILLKPVLNFGSISIIGVSIFMLIWGLNYLREPVYATLNRTNASMIPDESHFERLASDLVRVVNDLHALNKPSESDDFQSLDTAVNDALMTLIAAAYPYETIRIPNTKLFIANKMMNVAGISGIFLPIFMEPHMNRDLIYWERPCVMAHEKAHVLGFASETDANLIAYVTCLTSEHPAIRYSGALHVLISLKPYLPKDKMENIYSQLLPGVIKDIRAMYDRVRQNYERFSLSFRLSHRINDTYLKLNDQPLGIGSYGAALPQLVIWLANHRDVLSIQK